MRWPEEGEEEKNTKNILLSYYFLVAYDLFPFFIYVFFISHFVQIHCKFRNFQNHSAVEAIEINFVTNHSQNRWIWGIWMSKPEVI